MKQQNALPPLTNDIVDAFAASALSWLGWLLGVILQLGAPKRGRRLKTYVEQLERSVEAVIFLKAVLRLGAPMRQRGPARPLNAPAGFRRQRFARRRRLLFKSARICDRRLSLHRRVLAAIAALARPARFIARFAARLTRGLCGAMLLAIAPPAQTCARPLTDDAAYADTS